MSHEEDMLAAREKVQEAVSNLLAVASEGQTVLRAFVVGASGVSFDSDGNLVSSHITWGQGGAVEQYGLTRILDDAVSEGVYGYEDDDDE